MAYITRQLLVLADVNLKSQQEQTPKPPPLSPHQRRAMLNALSSPHQESNFPNPPLFTLFLTFSSTLSSPPAPPPPPPPPPLSPHPPRPVLYQQQQQQKQPLDISPPPSHPSHHPPPPRHQRGSSRPSTSSGRPRCPPPS